MNTDEEELAAEWEQKAVEREKLYEWALAGPSGTTGKRAAAVIAEAMKT